MIIGLTGGIASGKTTVTKILQELGAEIIDADLIAHQLLQKGEEGWKRVVNHFGRDILDGEGQIERKRLGKMVFNNPDRLKQLEQLTHPLIIGEIKKRIANSSDKDVVLDAPLLYETGLENLVDEVWVVYVDEPTQYQRLQKRDSMTRDEARLRLDAQFSLQKKKLMADKVIDNRGNLTQLREQVNKLWRGRDEKDSTDCS